MFLFLESEWICLLCFQGIIKLDHPCIHVDFPVVLCEAWYEACQTVHCIDSVPRFQLEARPTFFNNTISWCFHALRWTCWCNVCWASACNLFLADVQLDTDKLTSGDLVDFAMLTKFPQFTAHGFYAHGKVWECVCGVMRWICESSLQLVFWCDFLYNEDDLTSLSLCHGQAANRKLKCALQCFWHYHNLFCSAW